MSKKTPSFNFTGLSYSSKRRYVESKLKEIEEKQKAMELDPKSSVFSESEFVFRPPKTKYAYGHDNLSLNTEANDNFSELNIIRASTSTDFKESFDSDIEERFSDDTIDRSSSETKSFELGDSLAQWASENRITQNALSALLHILNEYHPELPLDARTLFGSAKSVISYGIIRSVEGGQYIHFGIVETLKMSYSLYFPIKSRNLELQINIDGLPLFKSSNQQIWPILATVNESKNKSPFVIGIFCGTQKPPNCSEYLQDFIDEVKVLQSDGLTIADTHFSFNIACFVCDAPARSFLKQVKGHNGHGACERCVQYGDYIDHHMTFPKTDSKLRSDTEFNEMIDEDHHTGQSPLRQLGLGMVSQFVLDYMHLVCLGVIGRLLHIWTKGPRSLHRLASFQIERISEKLLSTKLPKEFPRKIRSLKELDRWKATEFRTFLLYLGPSVLKGFLPPNAYNHFLCFAYSIYILCDPKLCKEFCDYSQKLLIFFVKEFGQIYGVQHLVYNIHNLVHLPDDCRKFGSLDSISAFPFENFLGQLKKLVRKPQHILQQLRNRLLEKNNTCGPPSDKNVEKFPLLKRIHFSGPTMNFPSDYTQYKECHFTNFCIKISEGDNCILVRNKVVLVRNILSCDNHTVVVYEEFKTMNSFSSYPLSSDNIGILRVDKLAGTLAICDANEVQVKFILIPFESNNVAIPLIHSSLEVRS